MQMLKSKEVPQANVLHDVIRTVHFVAQHKGCTYSMIAHHINKGERQGRYYRHSAQLLGLIENHNNYARILPDGQYFISLPEQEKKSFLIKRIRTLKVFQLTEELIQSKPGCTENDVYQLLFDNGITDNTAFRRASSIVNWLVDLNVVRRIGDNLYLI
jgi:hypothetical protein